MDPTSFESTLHPMARFSFIDKVLIFDGRSMGQAVLPVNEGMFTRIVSNKMLPK